MSAYVNCALFVTISSTKEAEGSSTPPNRTAISTTSTRSKAVGFRAYARIVSIAFVYFMHSTCPTAPLANPFS